MNKITIKVPATSANLGPGFDALGLALDLWNETEFIPAGIFSLTIEGEGSKSLASNEKNLIHRSVQKIYERLNRQVPALSIRCINRIPLASGLGSSAAAILTGLLGANALLGSELANEEILNLATEMEGHPDNIAPALLGGLVVSTWDHGRILTRQLPIIPIHITVVLPEFNFPTKQARAVLPKHASLKDAVHNISRVVLLTEAFRTGDMNLLGQAMSDTLHQPYRLPLIPGAQSAMEAAKKAGASAVALSGAGPSIIAFSAVHDPGIGLAISQIFESVGLSARVFELGVSNRGAQLNIDLSP
jgi:homoserine kinase